MAKYTPELPLKGAVSFDLAAIAQEMRHEDAYLRDGHTARTLAREADLRVVLVVMKADSMMAAHTADETASIQVIAGRVQLRLPDRREEVSVGQLLMIERGVKHDVVASGDSVFVLTLGWSDKQ
jgi:quercetin dioxygenase-like cupin family protein